MAQLVDLARTTPGWLGLREASHQGGRSALGQSSSACRAGRDLSRDRRDLLAGIKRPVVIVDWSDLEPRRRWLVIKAAAAVGGRAVSLYEKVCSMKRYNGPRTHREFLMTLKTILPEGCQPIIVPDAGFRGPWFKAVEAQGWDWVGRIRNKIKYYHTESGRWRYTDTLYKEATT
jgi:hypothetical protein